MYKSLYSVKVTKNTKILFYGAGTITKKLIPKYYINIIAIADQNYDIFQDKYLENIRLLPIEDISKVEYDYIFISPNQGREKSIIKNLKTKFNIKNNKFLILNKDV